MNGISPFTSQEGPAGGQPWPSQAGRGKQSSVPARSIPSRSGSSSLATQTEPQHGPGRQIASGPGAKALAGSPACPHGPSAGRCQCPALPWESTMRSSSLAGQSGEDILETSSKVCLHSRAGRSWRPALHPQSGLRSPRSLLSSSLQRSAGKCSVSTPALRSLLLPTFAAMDLSWSPSLSATCPGAPSKAACASSCLEKEQGGRKGKDSVGRARLSQRTPQPQGKEGGCFVIFGEHFHRQGEETGGADVAGQAVHTHHCCASTRASLANAWISCRLLPGPHWCHAIKMCSWLEFGSLASGEEGTSPLTEGVGAAEMGSCSGAPSSLGKEGWEQWMCLRTDTLGWWFCLAALCEGRT